MYEVECAYMIQNLEQIEYRKAIIEEGMRPEDLPIKIWRGTRKSAFLNGISMGPYCLI